MTPTARQLPTMNFNTERVLVMPQNPIPSQFSLQQEVVAAFKLGDLDYMTSPKHVVEIQVSVEDFKMAHMSKAQNEDVQALDTYLNAFDTAIDMPNWPGEPTKQEILESSVVSEAEIHLEKLQNRWKPTSLVPRDAELELAELEELIAQRAELQARTEEYPYDPYHWLALSITYRDLGYSDIYTSTAHKALTLIQYGLGLRSGTKLAVKVRKTVAKRISVHEKSFIVGEHLGELHLESFKALISGLLDCASMWDGLVEVKVAMKHFPKDDDLCYLESKLKEGLLLKTNSMKEMGISSENLKQASKLGSVYKRQYPWLPSQLFLRSPSLLKDINDAINSSNSIVRTANISCEERHTGDVGPLGIFATRNVAGSEVILIDRNITTVADFSTTDSKNCDACFGILLPEYMPEGEVPISATCCGKVAYCSQECYLEAMNGYHQVLCGKDFRWLHDGLKDQLAPGDPLLMLRIMAIVVSDIKKSRLKGEPEIHPLQHPLLARLTAGYTSTNSWKFSTQVWSFYTHVIAPTRILDQLGVETFADPSWSAEVIHTIFWRVLNNASTAATLTKEASSRTLTKRSTFGISPNFVFFNHSCDPNVSWSSDWEDTRHVKGGKGRSLNLIRAGSSAMLCVALRNIAEGEECRIAYVPRHNSKKGELGKWFEGGCGCCSCGGKDGTPEHINVEESHTMDIYSGHQGDFGSP